MRSLETLPVEHVRKHALDGAAGALLFAGVFTLYAASCSWMPGSWDTGEMQSVPYLLGVGHPTGFPLYTLLGYAFSHVVAVSTVAFRMNLFAAACSAMAVAALFAVMRVLGIPALFALLASLWFALVRIVWEHAVRSEVHDLALLLLVALLGATLHFALTGNRRSLYAGAVCFALAAATHPIAVLTIPGLLCALAFRRRDLDPRALLNAAGLAACGALLYLYVPLRSAYVVAHGLDPTVGLNGLDGALLLNYGDTRIAGNFVRYVLGQDFGAGGTLATVLDVGSWQSHLWSLITWIDDSFGSYAIVAAAIGVAAVVRANWRIALIVTLFCFGVVPFIDAYTLEGDADRYRLLPYAGVSIALAAAAGAVLGLRAPWWRQTLAALFLAASCAAQFKLGRDLIGKIDGGPSELVAWTARAVPPGSIFVTRWLDATAFGYGADIDGTFRGRIVVAGWWDDYAQRDVCQWSTRHPVYILIDGAASPAYVHIATRDPAHLLYRFVPARACGLSFHLRPSLHEEDARAIGLHAHVAAHRDHRTVRRGR
jgi:hypothetical protein